jgi:hypothetical protein
VPRDLVRETTNDLCLTMKWFERIAQDSVGFCSGVAIDNSPGLQPWVRQIETRALKVAPDVSANGGINTPSPEHAPRSPLSGRFDHLPNPGLKLFCATISWSRARIRL